MQAFGETFIDALPRHIANLRVPDRALSDDVRRGPLFTQIEGTSALQSALREVLHHAVTQEAQSFAERAMEVFLQKKELDVGVLKFFNGWHETHKTTSLVSARIIMRLAADALSVPGRQQPTYLTALAHMHEVAKDDFGLGHPGHDGMYGYLTAAFGAHHWADAQYSVDACVDFSAFLHDIGIAHHKAAMESPAHRQSIMDAMMVSVASELWNGREYNFLAQYMEEKLVSFAPGLAHDAGRLRYAKAYVLGHAGDVENRHGLHALAAAQVYGRAVGAEFSIDRLKKVLLEYTRRVGEAWRGLQAALLCGQ